MIVQPLSQLLLTLLPLSMQAAEASERQVMYDQAQRWPELIRFDGVRPRWLEGAEAFRFEGFWQGRRATLVVDCEARTVEADVDPDWPEVPGASEPVLRAPGAPARSPMGTGEVTTSGGALVFTGSGGRRELAEGEPENAWSLPDEPWSPDGRFLAATRTDRREVYHLPIHDYRETSPSTRLVPYTKTGGVFPRVTLAVFDVETGTSHPIDLGEGDHYAMIEGWRLGGRELLVHRVSRDAKQHDLLAVDPRSGAARLLLHGQGRRDPPGNPGRIV